jgi:hypothetical protein
MATSQMKAEINISWIWEKDSVPHLTLKMKVQKIQKTSTGFLWYKEKCLGHIDYAPNSTDVFGVCISDDHSLDGKTISLTLPGGEIRNIQAGNVVELETVNLPEKMY